MTVPCQGCPDRVLGCHGSCERYAAYKADMGRANANRCQDRVMQQVLFDSIQRMQRRDPSKIERANRRRYHGEI